ncbi:MAG: hypothetical protein DCC75_09895 [Proteobacteria bacterium]|nr:MAG: hypothetical protein DCC75_09895 [Pseudomonadota bacterium]
MRREGERRRRNQRGAGLAEYVILVTLISMTALNAVENLGEKPKASFCKLIIGGFMDNRAAVPDSPYIAGECWGMDENFFPLVLF